MISQVSMILTSNLACFSRISLFLVDIMGNHHFLGYSHVSDVIPRVLSVLSGMFHVSDVILSTFLGFGIPDVILRVLSGISPGSDDF